MFPGILEIIIIISAILGVFLYTNKLNNKFQLQLPECKSFFWGYFMGVFNVSSSILFIVVSLSVTVNSDNPPLALFLFIAFVGLLGLVLGYLIIKRSKVALILFTVISLNPVFWIINFIYIKNRWDELK